jgi:O-methyltransferase involved in polyketide biosynthesis
MSQSMATTATIIMEHRKAATQLRKELNDPQKARAFLIRAGILTKSGKGLSKRYR